MAAPKRNTRTNTPAASTDSKPFSFADVEVGTVDVLPKTVHMTEPNPLDQHVVDAVDQGPRYIGVPDGDAAWKAHNFLRRGAKDHNLAVSVRFTNAQDEPLTPDQAKASTDEVYVYFVVKSEKKARGTYTRRYTSDDIRKHFGLADGAKISKAQRDEYREVKGFNKKSDATA